jgi:hypothetical protein
MEPAGIEPATSCVQIGGAVRSDADLSYLELVLLEEHGRAEGHADGDIRGQLLMGRRRRYRTAAHGEHHVPAGAECLMSTGPAWDAPTDRSPLEVVLCRRGGPSYSDFQMPPG